MRLLAQACLALGRAVTVDPERRDRVGLYVWTRFRAVEDIFRRDVQQRYARRRAGLFENLGTQRIGGEDGVRLALGLVDGGVGGGVDYQRRPVGGKRSPHRGPVGDVALGLQQSGQRNAARERQRGQFAAELAAGA